MSIHSLTISTSFNFLIHLSSPGNLSSEIISIPIHSQALARQNGIIVPATMSKNPIVLPPKKSFPVTSFSRNIISSRVSSIATSIPFSGLTKGMNPAGKICKRHSMLLNLLNYLFINELGPESSRGSLVRILW
ncbi:hypothetical protein HID58_062523 [Brassica napus]|uniref:Uncharacterized protein n=1 Tax=Brassica napus TaxID=3708 RepID=A0ABQ8A1N1_BRANA|nr:hypothetical protein HID58_062523 [Brassica napus]